MNIAPGMRIGAYELTTLIGEGGMGRVFRARDTRLKREVAIKVLPDAVATDPDRLARFQREAEALAALNHSNIAALHDVVDIDGSPFLIMEFVDGETLADRIQRGALSIDDAIPIARQVADALDSAHERGIVHRDLKPANIKITPDGHVKVLDFGLAKLGTGWGGGGPRPDLTASPTVMESKVGLVVGTAAYMSPEQAKGKDADRTSDIWAFGCLLYEMLTGRPVFDGETAGEVLGRVFTQEPDWSRLPADTPPAIRRLLRRCLQKDRRQRLKDIGDARIEIEEAENEPSLVIAAARAGPRRLDRLTWIAVTIPSMVAAGAMAIALRPSPVAPELRVEITTPQSSDLLSFAISPDGQQLVLVATSEGRPRLWLRALATGTAHAIAGTDGASFPFWAPDSRAIGFFADGKVKRVDVAGGTPETLTTAKNGRGCTWNRDGVILCALAQGPIYRVSPGGAEPVPVTHIAPPEQANHRYPQFLPDGRRFVFYSQGTARGRGVYLGSLESLETRRLLDADTAAVPTSSGHLLFVRQGTLFGQRFDADRGVVTGEPYSLFENATFDGGINIAAVSASATESLAVRTGAAGGERRLVWVDRTGQQTGTVGVTDASVPWNPELSADGRLVAVDRVVNGNRDIWLIESARGTTSRLTFDAAVDIDPVWSPDGRAIVFSSNRKGVNDLYRKPSSGPGDEEVLLESSQHKRPLGFSQDGHFLLYREFGETTGWNLLALPLTVGGTPIPIAQSSFEERNGQFSPDGRWVAFDSNESGRSEIYVQPFPGIGSKVPVSAGGGAQPRWRRDGNELFYIGLDGQVMATPIRLGADGRTVDPGSPVTLFATRIAGGPLTGVNKHQYVAAPDAQRFLINVDEEEPRTPPIRLIVNWKPPTGQ